MIKQIVFVDTLDGTTGKVHPTLGILFIAEDRWKKMNLYQRKYFLYHEFAHTLGYVDEKEADQVASNIYRLRGLPLTQSVYAQTRLLNSNIPEHNERMHLQLYRTLQYAGYNIKEKLPGRMKKFVNN